jgi:hypothetical protein
MLPRKVPHENYRGRPQSWRRIVGEAGCREAIGLYRNVVDSWQLYDNSAVTVPRLIAAAEVGETAEGDVKQPLA